MHNHNLWFTVYRREALCLDSCIPFLTAATCPDLWEMKEESIGHLLSSPVLGSERRIPRPELRMAWAEDPQQEGFKGLSSVTPPSRWAKIIIIMSQIQLFNPLKQNSSTPHKWKEGYSVLTSQFYQDQLPGALPLASKINVIQVENPSLRKRNFPQFLS